MDMKVPERYMSFKMQLSNTLTKLYQVANLPRFAFAIRVGALVLSLFITYSIFSTSSSQGIDYRQALTTAVKGKKHVFIENYLEHEIDGPFNNDTIVDLCANTKWMPGVIFKCDAPEGGVGNVRNVFLNCLRYSIEAGASGFVIPEMLAITSGTKSSLVPFGHFFDLNYFTTSLMQACPQIRIYSHANDLYDIPSTSPAIAVVPTSFNSTSLIDKHVLANPGNWSLSFTQFLEHTHPVPPTAAKPVLISLAPSLLEFPLSYDDERFVPSFGRLLRFRLDARRIAAAVLYSMSQRYKLELLSTAEHPGIIPSNFYGAHLRTGVDATAAGWTSYDVQSSNYIREASHYQLPVMYVASGSDEDLARLVETGANNSIAIETKESLLSTPSAVLGQPLVAAKGLEKEWAALQTLTWDQQLLVDYEVLLRASVFGGTWESSFGWNVAMRRHVVAGSGTWKVISRREEIELLVVRGPGDEEAKADRTLPRRVSRITGRNARSEQQEASTSSSSTKDAVETIDIDAELFQVELKVRAEEKRNAKVKVINPGDKAFSDGLSVMFGPTDAGRRIVASMWP